MRYPFGIISAICFTFPLDCSPQKSIMKVAFGWGQKGIEEKSMKTKSILAASAAVLFVLVQMAGANNIYFEDGQTHVINTNRQADTFWLDKNISNSPGTHLEIQSGGSTSIILPFNYSTITLNGGSIIGGNVAIDTYGDNILIVNSGTIKGDIAANSNSRFYIDGGSLLDDVYAYDSGIVEIRGGQTGGIYGTYGNGKIYLYGGTFSVNGQAVTAGDSLRHYVPISPQYPEYYIGTVTGTLQNGSPVNNNFWIWASTSSDIIVIPEPATILLFGIGTCVLRRKSK